MKRRVAVLTSVAAIASTALSAAPATADQKPTPNNRCGAANMVNEHSAPHMVEAMMLHTNEHGDAGMYAAVARTKC
jgi:hypothetical protein